MQRKQKKGQQSLSGVPTVIITLTVLALIIAIGSIVLTDFRSALTEGAQCLNVSNGVGCSQAYNSSTDGLTSIDNVSTQMGTVGTIVVAAILLGLIVAAFVFFRRT